VTRLRIPARRRAGRIVACGICGAGALLAAPALSSAATAGTAPVAVLTGASSGLPTISPRPFAAGDPTAVPPQSKPDDIAVLGGDLYVTYQNGVGPDGTPSPTGVAQSTVVEYSPAGAVIQSWLLIGRCDGLGADPTRNRVLATVNEDNNSSLYAISPGVSTPAHYSYDPNPSEIASGETSPNGGTDSISVSPAGIVYLSHSNPDPGRPNTAAVYTLRIVGTTANLTPVFRVDSRATDVVTGKSVKLALTDPDSNRFIPLGSPILGGRLLQDAQGDGEVVIVRHPHTDLQELQRLLLINAETPSLQPTIDDIAEVTGPGTLYLVDQGADTVQTIDTANFTAGALVVAQPADSTTAPPTVGQLGVLSPITGVITHFTNTFNSPKGLVFVPAGG
jgi:hypothetical protein